MEDFIYEEITLAELSERFLLNNDFSSADIYDMQDMEIEVETLDTTGNLIYKKIKSFVIKDSVDLHYTDGNLKGTGNHKVIENGKEVYLKDHSDFNIVETPMQVVDIEVEDLHTYLANGKLNCNTTSGGKALAFHASVRLRLKSLGQIKAKVNGVEMVIGSKTEVTVQKNRMGPPLRKVVYDIYFDSGIDDHGSWLSMMKTYNLVKESGRTYTYTFIDPKSDESTDISFQSKDFKTLLESNAPLKQQIYEKICAVYIMDYKINTDFGIDDVTVTTDFLDEEM